MRIPMYEMAEGDGKVLAGAPHGRRVFSRMMEKTAQEPDSPEPVFLDFLGVEVATASFLRETVLGYRDTVRGRHSNLYPVVANGNGLILEELGVLIAVGGDVVMACALDENGIPHDPRVIGKLDPKQRSTFELVRERGETDASELMRAHGEHEGTKTQTAWNNRLSSLANLGLIVELSQGRGKRYRPLLQEN